MWGSWFAGLRPASRQHPPQCDKHHVRQGPPFRCVPVSWGEGRAMATIELWIQIENHAWDVAPRNINRMTGETMGLGIPKTLNSPETGATRTNVLMYKPLSEDAVILRRYTKDWAAPEDRKINPWDLNEPDPTDAGTMGTIPGATIECNVGDTVRVHFRNMDLRTTPAAPWERGQPLAVLKRTHSLHTHGFTFPAKYDGAYPLSPPDVGQPIE